MIRIYSTQGNPKNLAVQVALDFKDIPQRHDNKLVFYPELIAKVEEREEMISVRYMPGQVRIPYTEDGWLNYIQGGNPQQLLGIIEVPAIVVATVDDFPEGFARLDEYETKTEMIEDLNNIYKVTLKGNELLSGYFLGRIQ